LRAHATDTIRSWCGPCRCPRPTGACFKNDPLEGSMARRVAWDAPSGPWPPDETAIPVESPSSHQHEADCSDADGAGCRDGVAWARADDRSRHPSLSDRVSSRPLAPPQPVGGPSAAGTACDTVPHTHPQRREGRRALPARRCDPRQRPGFDRPPARWRGGVR